MRKMKFRIKEFGNRETSYSELMRSFQGFNAYAKWANTYHKRRKILKKIRRTKIAIKGLTPFQIVF